MNVVNNGAVVQLIVAGGMCSNGSRICPMHLHKCATIALSFNYSQVGLSLWSLQSGTLLLNQAVMIPTPNTSIQRNKCYLSNKDGHKQSRHLEIKINLRHYMISSRVC